MEGKRRDRPSTLGVTAQRTLLGCGIVGPTLFVVVLLVEGALRPGYDPTYHVGSALSLGDRSWIQIANFVLSGALVMAYAVGIHQSLRAPLAAGLVGLVGVGLMVAGIFVMDPMRGYPPGTAAGTPTTFSWHHQVHDVVGPVVFLIAIPAACVVIGLRLKGAWRVYSFVTAAAAIGLVAWFAPAWKRDAPNAGLLQRAMIVFDFAWMALVAAHLRSRAPTSHL